MGWAYSIAPRVCPGQKSAM